MFIQRWCGTKFRGKAQIEVQVKVRIRHKLVKRKNYHFSCRCTIMFDSDPKRNHDPEAQKCRFYAALHVQSTLGIIWTEVLDEQTNKPKKKKP